MKISKMKIDGKVKNHKSIFSIDLFGSNLVSSSISGDVNLYNEKGVVLKTFKKHSCSALCVRFSPCGKNICVSYDDGNVVIYDTEGEVKYSHKSHTGDVSGLVYTDSFLVSVGYDGFVTFYQLDGSKVLKKIKSHTEKITGVAYSKTNKLLVTQGNDALILYSGMTIIKKVDIPAGVVLENFFSRMDWSQDGEVLACGLMFNNKANTVEIFDKNLKSIHSLIGHVAPIEVVAFNPNIYFMNKPYHIIVLASQDLSISLWNSLKPYPFLLLKNIVDMPILDMKWNEEGTVLYFCSYDGLINKLEFNENELGDASRRDVPPEDGELFLTTENVQLHTEEQNREIEKKIMKIKMGNKKTKSVLIDEIRNEKVEEVINETKEDLIDKQTREERDKQTREDVRDKQIKEDVRDKQIKEDLTDKQIKEEIRDNQTVHDIGQMDFAQKKEYKEPTKSPNKDLIERVNEIEISKEITKGSIPQKHVTLENDDHNANENKQHDIKVNLKVNGKRKRIVPTLLDDKSTFGSENLFIFNYKKPTVDFLPVEEFNRKFGDFEINLNKERTCLTVTRDNLSFYKVHGNIKTLCASSKYLCVYSDVLKIFELRTGNLLFPSIGSIGICFIDIYKDKILYLEVDGRLFIIDLIKHSTQSLSIPSSGELLAVTFSKHYYIICKFKDAEYFLDKSTGLWYLKKGQWNTITTTDTDYTNTIDETINKLENDFLVYKISKDHHKMKNVVKKFIKKIEHTNHIQEVVENKLRRFLLDLYREEQTKFVYKILRCLNKKFNLQYFISDLLKQFTKGR